MNSLNSVFIIYTEYRDCFYWEWAGIIAQKRARSNTRGHETFSYSFSKILTDSSFLDIHRQLLNDAALIKKINLTASLFQKVIITERIHENTYRDYLYMYSEEKYEKIIALAKDSNNDSPELNSLISLCYYSLYNYNEALKYILLAEKVDGNSEFKKIRFAILCEKGIQEMNREILEQAKEIFLGIESQDWGWMDHYNYGNVLTGLDELDEAESHYLIAISIEPNEPMIWKNLSTIYKKRGEIEKELDHLNRALFLNGDIIEAIICKAISLGDNYSRYDEGIVLLRKALEKSKGMMIDNRPVYFYLGKFYGAIRKFDEAMAIIQEGLVFHPGDEFLENYRLSLMIGAAEHDSVYESMAEKEFRRLCVKFPKYLGYKIALLKILKKRHPSDETFTLIEDSFSSYDYRIDRSSLKSFSIDEVLYVLENLDIVAKYRTTNDMGKFFFQSFPIGISDVQSIELKMNLLLLVLDREISMSEIDEMPDLYERHAAKLSEYCRYCSQVIARRIVNLPFEEKIKGFSVIIAKLPEIILIELSNQIGWLLSKHRISPEVADRLIEKSSFIKNWFHQTIEPTLQGANDVLHLFVDES